MWQPDPLPKQLGRYRLLRHLGRGAFGTVYEAEDVPLERRVALKLPHFATEDRPGSLARFHREAKAAASLSHPHICRVHDLGVIEGIPYLAMEYIEGRPLYEWASNSRPLPVPAAVLLVIKLAQAMQEAHDHGVIHRDLKPANILLDSRNEPIIVDWGLARRTANDSTLLTLQGQQLGTPAYMAPEQARGELTIDHRCDVFSLGVILFELLTGQVPFGGTPAAVWAKLLTEDAPPPSSLRTDIHQALDQICKKAMARNVAERYPNMRAMIADLEKISPKIVAATTPRTSSRYAPEWGLLLLGVLQGALAWALAEWPTFFSEQPLAPWGLAVLLALSALVCMWKGLTRRRTALPATVAVAAPADPAVIETRTPPPSDAGQAYIKTPVDLHNRRQKEPPELESDELAPSSPLEHEELVRELAATRENCTRMKEWIAKWPLARNFYQPVLVVGPKGVGKTSLVRQWHTPWDHREVEGSRSHRACKVPVHEEQEKNRVPHPAAGDVQVISRLRLGLHVHDFPGEIQAQQRIGQLVRKETENFRKTSQKDLGVVIICMFDASEICKGIRVETNQYYNGELFRELRRLVSADTVGLERLIVVYNKLDLLREKRGAKTTDEDLLKECRRFFEDTSSPLRRIVIPERVYEIGTVLAREDQMHKSQGGPIILGEAIRPLVEAFLGQNQAVKVLEPAGLMAAAAVEYGL